MQKLTFFVFLLVVGCCICMKLPPIFKKCNRSQSNFNPCLRDAVEDAIRKLNKPRKRIGLNSLDPLVISAFTIAPTRLIAFEQKFTNYKMFGLNNMNLLNLDMNFETKTLFMDCLFPEVTFEFDYDFDGKILSMPIKGRGSGSFITENLKFVLTFNLGEYEKEGEKYYEVVGFKCAVDMGSVIELKLENLFDGDKVLGDKINKVVNENWRILFDNALYLYEPVFGEIFSTLFNRLLVKVPINELFGTETITTIIQ